VEQDNVVDGIHPMFELDAPLSESLDSSGQIDSLEDDDSLWELADEHCLLSVLEFSCLLDVRAWGPKARCMLMRAEGPMYVNEGRRPHVR
jgi:hypothetical protein